MSSSSADRNLLFGLLALKMDFVTRDGLLDAMSAWLDRKADPLGLILQERGALSAEDGRAVAHLVERHLARHGGDARRSLAALPVETPLRQGLAALADADVRASAESLAPVTVGDASLPAPPTSPAARAASRYRRLRDHARGGLGEVSVALDEELGREVALKEIQGRVADRSEFRARFVREAEITGHLEHPGIVPVYGLGHHPDGRPYYAMRFIRGESLQDAMARFHFADDGRRDAGERELELRRLLARFVAVCNAVAYAHSRGVIHRDLKPANVMLGEYGETYVVDWGLAKVLAQPEDATAFDRPPALAADDSSPTREGQAAGTPAFMPPEQARGEWDKVGPQSDVFSLGATLYALLTGSPPYSGSEALARAARGDAAPARRVNARVPAALEAVCARAMAASPEGRYATARLLAADVERWLADEPVGAYRDPVSVKMSRWARRNRTLVSSAVVLLLASVAGLGVGLAAVNAERARTTQALDTSQQNLARAVSAEGEARDNLKQAEDNLALARRAVDQTFGIAKDHPLLNQPDIRPEMRRLRQLLLEKALPFYEGFRARRPRDAGVQSATADQHFRVATIRAELSEPAQAVPLYREAERLARQVIQAQPDEVELLGDLSRILNNLGRELTQMGRGQEAGECYTESVALSRRLVQLRPKVAAHKATLALNLHNLSRLRAALGEQAGSQPLSAEAVALGRDLVKAHPREAAYAVELALALNGQGVTQKDLGQRKEALQSYDESIALSRELVTRHPAVPRYASEMASTLHNRAMLLHELARPKDALASYTEAIALRRRVVAAQPDIPQYQVTLARTLNTMGHVQGQLRQPAAARASYTEAVEIGRRLVKGHPEVVDFQAELSTALNSLAQSQLAAGEREQALDTFDEAVAVSRGLIARQPGAPNHRDGLARVLNNRGLALEDLRRLDEARDSFAGSVELRRRLAREGPDVPDYRHTLVGSLKNLGRLLLLAGRGEEALRIYTEAAALSRQLNQQRLGVPAYLDSGAFAVFHLGMTQRALGRRLAATRSFAEAAGLWRELSKAQPDDRHHRYNLALALLQVAFLQAGAGQLREAAGHDVEAADLLRALAKAHPEDVGYQDALADTLLHLLRLQARLGPPEAAMATSTEVIDLLRRVNQSPARSARHPDALALVVVPLRIRSSLYRSSGQPTRARADLDEAVEALAKLRQLAPRHGDLAHAYLTHVDRAHLLMALRKPAEALADFDQALAVVPPAARGWVRLRRAYGLNFAGEHDRAAAEAAELSRGPQPANTVYDLARLMAASAALVSADARRPLPVRERQAELRARFAVALLGRAAKAGLIRGRADLDYVDKDAGLAYLRGRGDYRAWRASLAPAKP